MSKGATSTKIGAILVDREDEVISTGWNDTAKNFDKKLQDDVLKNTDKSWDFYHYFSNNANITMENVLKNPEKRWNYYYLSRHPNTTLKILLDNSEKPWNRYGLNQNPNITIQYILDHPEIRWDYEILCSTANISIKDVLNHPELPWDFRSLIQNINITIRDVLDHPELPWNYRYAGWYRNYDMNNHKKHQKHKKLFIKYKDELLHRSHFRHYRNELYEIMYHPVFAMKFMTEAIDRYKTLNLSFGEKQNTPDSLPK